MLVCSASYVKTAIVYPLKKKILEKSLTAFTAKQVHNACSDRRDLS